MLPINSSLLMLRQLCWAVGLSCLLASGCATTSNKWVSLRATPSNPLTDTLGLVTRQGPKPTPRTLQLLRRYDLDPKQVGHGSELLAKIQEIDGQGPSRDHLYAIAELAYVAGKKADRGKRQTEALELYGTALLHSYRYLFDDGYAASSNPYDPQFRRACDLYNTALEDTLRVLQECDPIRPGSSRTIATASHDCQIDVQLHSRHWHDEDLDHLEFVSDFQVHGLRNHYHRFGLGVPLVAVRRHHEDADPREQFYPPDLSFPLTAFLRISQDQPQGPPSSGRSERLRAVLELHDPLDKAEVEVASAHVPLETDLSTPLAHYLSQPALDDNRVSTAGLLMPEKVEQLTGLYMLEPFRTDKIPVLMVHGLWSSPVTWMEMFNDLRSDPKIREHYQFWFYLYPTGQPFWFSAAKMREDLTQMRSRLDPAKQHVALDQMVLVGHSMGGLVSKLQTVDSGNRFWETLSERPFAELEAEREVREDLAGTFFFAPSASVRRVVTIGTPHRGSEFSNDLTRWLGRKLIHIPARIMQGRHQLIARNPDYFRPDAPLNVSTSIDSLSPSSKLLPVLLTSETGPWVKYHNIIGHRSNQGVGGAVSKWLAGEGDGVVSLESARVENAVSEVVVTADHSSVHRHPQSILEVRRILMEHVDQLRTFPYGDGVEQVSTPAAGSPSVAPSDWHAGVESVSAASQQRSAYFIEANRDSTTARRPPAAVTR